MTVTPHHTNTNIIITSSSSSSKAYSLVQSCVIKFTWSLWNERTVKEAAQMGSSFCLQQILRLKLEKEAFNTLEGIVHQIDIESALIQIACYMSAQWYSIDCQQLLQPWLGLVAHTHPTKTDEWIPHAHKCRYGVYCFCWGLLFASIRK